MNDRSVFKTLATFVVVLLASVLMLVEPTSALDHVTLRRDGRKRKLEGRVVVTAEDGGLLLQTRGGTLWRVTPDEIVSHSKDDKPFKPLTQAEQAQRILAELPPGFEAYKTKNYLVCHNTTKAYARWCGGLYERLYKAFETYWSRRGFKLEKCEFPLVALVFADQASYAKYAKPDLGDNAKSIIGYYSLRTNHVTMYDLTGAIANRQPGDRRGSPQQIRAMLARPQAAANVATVIHEATHQIAFNRGMQTRFSDVPLWLSEGLAMYFETPDLKSTKGWRGIGGVNPPRLRGFRRYAPARPARSLKTLIADDRRFRNPASATDAYSEGWALTYFLIRRYPKQYSQYLKTLADKEPLVWDTPEQRIKDFQAAFGQDLGKLDAQFLKYLRSTK